MAARHGGQFPRRICDDDRTFCEFEQCGDDQARGLAATRAADRQQMAFPVMVEIAATRTAEEQPPALGQPRPSQVPDPRPSSLSERYAPQPTFRDPPDHHEPQDGRQTAKHDQKGGRGHVHHLKA